MADAYVPAEDMPDSNDHIEFRLVEGNRPTVSVDVLTEVLTHAQKAVYLLAMSAKGHEVRQRVRVPAEIKDRFALQCEVPTEGSYVQPLGLPPETTLFEGSPQALVLGAFKEVASALDSEEWDRVQAVVPDSVIRHRLIDEFAGMMPPPGERWTLGMQNGQGTFATFDTTDYRRVTDRLRLLRQPQETSAEPVTLAGELTEIDFAEHKLTLRLYRTNRALQCEYAEDLEEMLIENRRGLLQVSGLVELDDRDRPIRLTNVFDIREVDLSALTVERFETPTGVVRFREGPRTFEVVLEDSGEYFVVEDEDLDLHVFADSRDGLAADLDEQLVVLWTEYALAAPSDLTDGAARLRATLLEQLTAETDDA